MNELIEFHQNRSLIATSVMTSIQKNTANDGIRRLTQEALRLSVLKDSITNLFGAVVQIETEVFPDGPVPNMEEIIAEVIDPLSEALNKEMGIPLCARDIGEAIPHQKPLPQVWLDHGWDSTDVMPDRYPALMRGDIRLHAYPLIHEVLKRNNEWFPAAYFLQKNAFDNTPQFRRTILRDIFSAANGPLDEYTFCAGKPGKYLMGYLAPELWPPGQRQDMLAVFQAVKVMHKDIVMKMEAEPSPLPLDHLFIPPEDAGLLKLFELYIDVMNEAVRPGANLRLASSTPRPEDTIR